MHLVLLSEYILLSAAKTRKSLKICSNVPPVYRPLKGHVQKYQGERGGRKMGVFHYNQQFLARLCVSSRQSWSSLSFLITFLGLVEKSWFQLKIFAALKLFN